MSTLRIILPYHLSEEIISIKNYNHDDLVFFFEAKEFFTDLPHHPQKIVFQIAAMRHFAKSLSDKKYNLKYIKFEDASKSFAEEIMVLKKSFNKVIVAEAYDYKTNARLKKLGVEILEDDRFLCTRQEFNLWANKKKQLRMEFFYREMRKKYNILIKNHSPIGGVWNYDHDNRSGYKQNITPPARIKQSIDPITADVISIVSRELPHHFGDLEEFNFAVTREQALIEAKHFMIEILPCFGKYQDVMISDEVYLFHSRLSMYLNNGLLYPLELCKMAENQYYNDKAPLPAVEGFIRQIIGWREFIRGIYWKFMPDYQELNFLGANLDLPSFFWGGKTKIRCISEVVHHTRKYAYSHHIQRLMITGNFALLAGLDVKQVQNWYLAVYADAHEWVEMPNTLGMALFGDGGIVGSKPYAASGNYINKMSNFCANCSYDYKQLTGENACPFNALYWNFFMTHKDKLHNNQRLKFVYNNLNKFSDDKKKAITDRAQYILNNLNNI
jgi:deoxyribodipyrimidine photolyase-related protein